MVNTGEIHNAEEALKTVETGLSSDDQNLDDVMLAMDVVDTLRHEQNMVEKELAGDERREALITRLRDIYKAQGIQVSDEVLMDGVLALEEQRFAFEPPRKTFALKLAKFYISRRRWMPILTLFLFVLGAGWGINHFAFERPAKLEAARVETLFSKTLPDQLGSDRDSALAAAKTDEIKSRVNDVYNLGLSALKNKDAKAAQKYSSDLSTLSTEITQSYELRVVNRPNEASGAFMTNDNDARIRNYYLIVEATNATGEPVKVTITSEEQGNTKRTSVWGLRVPKSVYQSVGDDKRDDLIIQRNLVGVKKPGFLEPEYTIETSGGKVLEW